MCQALQLLVLHWLADWHRLLSFAQLQPLLLILGTHVGWGLQDKVNMSVAIIPMAQDFHWSPGVSGSVHAAFFYGGCLQQPWALYLPGVASRLGAAAWTLPSQQLLSRQMLILHVQQLQEQQQMATLPSTVGASRVLALFMPVQATCCPSFLVATWLPSLVAARSCQRVWRCGRVPPVPSHSWPQHSQVSGGQGTHQGP
jgi:hypothetical protein